MGSLQRSPILRRINVPLISPPIPCPLPLPLSHLTPCPLSPPPVSHLILHCLLSRSDLASFQEIQYQSTTTTSLYFIPTVIAGAATNIASGLLVSRVKANHLALAGAVGTMIAPLVMANMDIEWSYWRAAFWAMCLCPLSADGTPKNPLFPLQSHFSLSPSPFPGFPPPCKHSHIT